MVQLQHDDPEAHQHLLRTVGEDAVLGALNIHLQSQIARSGAMFCNLVGQSDRLAVVLCSEVLASEVKERVGLRRSFDRAIRQKAGNALLGERKFET
jgi:hypothetical protein